MTVKIIAENILDDDDFSSATEQAGEYIGQPDPDSSNSGFLRPITKGDSNNNIYNLTYSGTATGNGTTTTMVDSELCIFGDDFLIGATVTFLTGANTSGTVTITDFAQSTGTLTWSGAVNATLTGDTFSLTLSYSTMDFRLQLVSSGDVGEAKFKWSHDGGATYFGREEIDAADWTAESAIETDLKTLITADIAIAQNANDDWLVFYSEATGDDLEMRKSTDNGLTWGSPIVVRANDSDNPAIHAALVLSSGRIIAWYQTDGNPEASYSDDDGTTWGELSLSETFHSGSIIELSSGNLIEVYGVTSVSARISSDEGSTWSSAVTVASDANLQGDPSVAQADNGDIVCVYQSDEESSGDYEIKCKISSDGGVTWGSTIDVMDFGSYDVLYPSIAKDLNGDLYCAAVEYTTDKRIVYAKSTDNGATWAADKQLITISGDDLVAPNLLLMDGHQLVCLISNDTHSDLIIARKGRWETYSSNGCIVAPNLSKQRLVCDINTIWQGNAGISNDLWSFKVEYSHCMENLITDNPNRAWRSENDNAACNILLDAGTNERFYADGVAFFGANIRAASFQMHTADSWGAPDTDETISFDISTAGVVDSVDGTYIKDSALLSGYKDHELTGKYLRMTSGIDEGVTFRIKDSVGDYIVLDTTASNSIGTSDTFCIFQGNIAATFTQAVTRYMRIAISAQHTYDDFYKIGSMVVGKVTTLTNAWLRGYSKTIKSGVDLLRPPDGGIIPIERRDNKRVFDVSWNAADTTKNEIESLFEYLKGKNLALIPDSDDMTDVYLCKVIGDIKMQHWYLGKFNFSITFEEV